MYKISAIWMNQMPCSITSIARSVGSRAPADFEGEATPAGPHNQMQLVPLIS